MYHLITLILTYFLFYDLAHDRGHHMLRASTHTPLLGSQADRLVTMGSVLRDGIVTLYGGESGFA